MNIPAVNIINSNIANRNNDINNKKVANKGFTIKDIAKNSLSEAIGRSQVVSFKGQNSVNGPHIKHECNEMFKRIKESINYNKIDGSYVHTITGYDGSLKSQEEYYPFEEKEVITKILDNGDKVVTVKCPEVTTITRTNESGKELFYKETRADGSSLSRQTQSKRQILKETSIDGRTEIGVIDLKTGLFVTSGPLVLNEKYDENTKTYYTENIITGSLYKKAEYFPNDKLKHLVEYFEETDIVSHEVIYNNKTGLYEDASYDRNGRLKTFVFMSKDGRNQEIFEYASNGRDVLKHYSKKFDKKDSLNSEIIFEPDSNIIITETTFSGRYSDVTYYKRNPNVPTYTESYDGNIIIKRTQYRNDGKTFLFDEEYKSNGEILKTHYTESGKKFCTDKYDNKGFMYESVQYYPGTNAVDILTKYDKYTGKKTKLYYDRNFSTLTDKRIYDENDKLVEEITYYTDGQTPKFRKVFNPNGSYRQYSYDIRGVLIGSDDYDSSGRKKSEYQQRQRYSAYRQSEQKTQQTQQKKSDNPDTLDEEALKRILNVVSCNDRILKEIDDVDWNVLTRLTGISKSGLIDLDHDTYRKLSKKFHPDLNKDDTLAQTVYIILNGLNLRKK